MGRTHLIPLKPHLFNAFECPRCEEFSPTGKHVLIPGAQNVAEYHCPACGLDFRRELPAGFAIEKPFSWSTETGTTFNSGKDVPPEWRLHPGHTKVNTERPKVQRHVRRRCKQVVILNTLDYLYGHVLLKLFNAQHYLDHHPDLGLVVMVPKMFEWLVPEGVAEVWVFDMKLSQGTAWNQGIVEFVQSCLPDYEEIFLAPAYSHIDFTAVNIKRFSGVEPFDLEKFSSLPPQVTFIARMDRLWHPSPWDKLLHRASRKLRLFPQWAVRCQDRLVARTIAHIRRAVPDAAICVVGLARPGGMPKGVRDLRTLDMNVDIERLWCETYAQSQVVVGVHGSNMLLPTAHAAGCVEILPYDRYGNMVQDLAVKYDDRMQLFMYRFVDEFASPRAVARHVASMFREFDGFKQNMQTNTFNE